MIDSRGTILLLEPDLFFVVKVREPLQAAGYTVELIKTRSPLPDATALRIRATATPAVVCLVVRFGLPAVDWEAVIRAAHAADIAVLAYGSHVDLAGQQRARDAGATRILANSKFTADVVGQVRQTMARHPSIAREIEDEQ